MSKYRSLEDSYKNRTLNHYKARSLDLYRTSKLYPKPYRNPKPVRKYSRPQAERRGRGRLHHPKPNYFQSPKPEKKYELTQNSKKMSNPPVAKTPRYTIEKPSTEKWVDTEEIVKEVEKRLDGKLTERLLEKFGTELEELLRKVENSEKLTEQEELEPNEQETEKVEGQVEKQMRNEHWQMRDGGAANIESGQDSPEVPEESKEDSVPLEGSFRFSRAFGLAIPTETSEEVGTSEQSAEKSETSITGEATETKNDEVENVEEETESAESEEESVESEHEEVEAEDMKSEPERDAEESAVDVEIIEDNKVEGSVESEETSEVHSEPLPEEAELYPIEEPLDSEMV